MSIRVLYFASLKDTLGRAEDILDYAPNLSVKKLWQELNPTVNLPGNTLTAVNMEYVKLSTIVADGDEVAFFPPVTGG